MEAAVSNAAGIAPVVVGVIEKATAGVYLLPGQQLLLHVGLQVLAAAREAPACGPFLRLLRRPRDELDCLLGEGCVEFATGVILGLWGGDADALFALASGAAVSGEVRWSAFQVLSRLVHDRRVDRDRLVDLLDRFDRERLANDADAAWEGWQDAVLYLGLVDFVGRVERAWADGRLPYAGKADQQEFREAVEVIAADPGDDGYLIRDHVVPITDPMQGLEWLVQGAGPAEGEGPDADPAGEAPDDDARAEIIGNLPTLLIGAWAFWRDREAGGRKAGQPVRSVKTGRNDPCPCGSGRKFKKCCGSGSQSVH